LPRNFPGNSRLSPAFRSALPPVQRGLDRSRFPLLSRRGVAVRVGFSIAAGVKPWPDHRLLARLRSGLVMPHGALASLRGRRQPPHDGMRRMEWYNLWDALAADRRQDRPTLRTHPTRRPREDIFSAGAERVICLPPLFLRSPPAQAAGTAALSLLQRNSLPSTHIRCRTTARRLATATMARRIPRR
jgi:hypothetical protein